MFHELQSVLQPPPAVALLDRLDRDQVGPDATVDLLVSQGILCCRQIHRIATSSIGQPDEEVTFLNLSMLDVVLNRITSLVTDDEMSARLEGPQTSVQDIMLRIAKDHYGPFRDSD